MISHEVTQGAGSFSFLAAQHLTAGDKKEREDCLDEESGINLRNEQATPGHIALHAIIMHLCLTGGKIRIQVSLENESLFLSPGPEGL